MTNFDIQLFADETDTALYDLDDVLTMAHGVKLANRTKYLIDQKIGIVENATSGNVAVFDSDGGIADSGHGIATNDEFLAMLNDNLPNSNKLSLSATDFTLAAGASTDVTVTRLGDGAISVSNTTVLEGLAYEISDTTITFSNSSATEGTGVFKIDVEGTAIFNPSSTTVSITGSSAG